MSGVTARRPPAPNRRGFLKGATAGLLVGFSIPTPGSEALADARVDGLTPNAFVRIGRDGGVTIISKYLEMGQGINTGIAMVLAEELDADWASITVESAPVNVELYLNAGVRSQGTGGSTSMMAGYEQLRQAGAAARALLVEAAARQWSVPPAEIRVARGIVSHPPSGRDDGFGAFVETARALPLPRDVRLKSPTDYTINGKPTHRIDSLGKTTGALRYTADLRLPGMVHAVIRRPMRFGATARSMDASAALAMPGVRQVVKMSTGVAVVADTHWSAVSARAALRIDWDEEQAEKRSSADLVRAYRALAATPGAPARNEGDVDEAFRSAEQVVAADYDLPYLAHATMEPLNCLVRLSDAECELWYGCQFQSGDQANVAKALGIPTAKVTIHTLPAGGSFGRRGSFTSDFVLEAVEVAKALPRGTPVLLQWTREDDITGGCYRPMSCHRIEAGLDAKGLPLGWRHRIVVQSIGRTIPIPGLIRNGVDPISIRNAVEPPYQLPALRVELHSPTCGVTVMPWRSVGASYNVFVMESFVDRLAHAAGTDPLTYRRRLLPADSRFHALIDAVERNAHWTRRTDTRAMGVAISSWAGTFVAQVAEVRREGDKLKVDRVHCVVDCGHVVNPNLVTAQMQGGIAFGLSAALFSEITLKDGIPEQHNFDGYRVLRMTGMPTIDVQILPSTVAPSGVGETAVPAVAPAVANAVYALTGIPVTHLPMRELFAA